MRLENLDEDARLEIAKLQHLAGINRGAHTNDSGSMSPLTQSGTAKGEYMRKHDIRPGSKEWFQLWFARPGMTGEDPMPLDSQKK